MGGLIMPNGTSVGPIGRPVSPAVYGVVLTLVIQLIAVVAFMVTIKVQGEEMQRSITRIESRITTLDRDLHDVDRRVARIEGDTP